MITINKSDLQNLTLTQLANLFDLLYTLQISNGRADVILAGMALAGYDGWFEECRTVIVGRGAFLEAVQRQDIAALSLS